MPDVGFGNLFAVAAIAFAAPLLLGFAPRLKIPAVVLEIVAGIVLGPSGPGWVHADLPVQITALLGLAFLLFLAGLEIDVHRLRGPVLRAALLGYAGTLALGLGAGFAFGAAGWVRDPLLVAVALPATSLPFLVTASQIGVLTGLMTPVTAAALVCAGLASVLLFPAGALAALRPREPAAVR